jgi:hypothetical protein
MYFDGRRDQRRYLNDCLAAGGVAFGPNTQFEGSGWVVHHVESHRAVCGSAMVVLASDFEIHDCIIQDNGRGVGEFAPVPGLTPWSDGMTILLCDNGFIHTNWLTDNTDIQLVIGGAGPSGPCRAINNSIASVNRHGFAGLNIGARGRAGGVVVGVSVCGLVRGRGARAPTDTHALAHNHAHAGSATQATSTTMETTRGQRTPGTR